jgi:hypothetical protein
MGSPRHWNVRRHILRSHGGLGEPTNEFGKTREEQQRLMNINLQFGHGNYYHNSQKSPSFPFKSSVGGGSTLKDRLPNYNNNNNNNNNNNKLRWDFMDDFIEPVKKRSNSKEILLNLYRQINTILIIIIHMQFLIKTRNTQTLLLTTLNL